MDSNPICHPSPANKMKCFFLDYVHFWWLARLVEGLKPHLPPLSSQKNEMLTFGLRSLWMISQAGQWTQTPSTIPLQPKKMKCSFLDYVQLLMISWAGQWTWTTSATPLLPKKWNAHFSNTFNFWWSARLVDGLKPHLPPLCSQKNEILIFGLCPTSHVGQTGQWTQTPSTTPLQPIKWNASFLDYAQLLMIGQAGRWTQTPSATSLQPKKWNTHFWITFTLDDQPGWSMDSNPIHHPSPPKKMKCSFLGYVQLLMISWAVRWTQTPFATPLQPIKWNAHFWITFNFWWSAGLVDGLEPYPPPVCSQKMKCSYFDYVQLLMIGRAVWWTRTPSTTPLHPKKWNPHFYITFNFWCWPDWSMDSNPIHHPSPANKMKCFFLDYVHFWWSARLVDGLKPHLPPLSSQ